jgi:hypothetical protein
MDKYSLEMTGMKKKRAQNENKIKYYCILIRLKEQTIYLKKTQISTNIILIYPYYLKNLIFYLKMLNFFYFFFKFFQTLSFSKIFLFNFILNS